MNTTYRLCAIDLDDTLLNSNHVLSDANRKVVQKVAQMGVIVIIASGRMHETTLPTVQALGLQTPVISYNGAMIRNPITGETWLNETVPPELADEIRAFARENRFQLNYYLDDHIYSAEHTPWMELYQQRTGAHFEILPDFYERLKGTAPTKLIIVTHPATVQELLPIMQQRYQGRLTVMRSNVEYLEFLPLNASKGKALAIVAERFQIPAEETIAIGDSWNDISMLQWAGLGVAVDNAKPEVKAVAKRIVPSCDEDGVAVALNEIFQIKENNT
ncbi:Cof-type HAD-IIB family hydrolase [Chthonomonas calidirosea]|uniref:Cof-type HAD-IIB family hydrolase n=1 Tax=Chthonomonas calidirosea TaxID=454171 RepID=UPI0006EC4740|nr:Cof-type HAD-IIB family hydrolase [Chthonomonas calidirosea]CEK14326.1 HAD-superfamily hydrolase, subfamily IIB [Chthonomonas calidirosea]